MELIYTERGSVGLRHCYRFIFKRNRGKIMADNKFMQTSLSNKSVVDRIVDQITNAIINGELHPGDKIPTEQEMCDTFGVGRNSVREAIKILVAYGVLEIRRADGTYICQEYNNKMLYPILYGIILHKDAKRQIIELRKVIDLGILREAMVRMGPEDFDKLTESIREMSAAMQRPDAQSRDIFEADVKFHALLTGLLENQLLESIGYYVDKITRQSRIMAIDYIMRNGHKEEFVLLHREILDMLQNRDANRIPEILDRHYKYWEM